MKNFFLICCFIVNLNAKTCFSQISSPGLGNSTRAGWFALGVRQELDTIKGKGWQSMSYVGVGRSSGRDNNSPLYKRTLFVVNQEFYHQFHTHWQHSIALSYRKQNEYSDPSENTRNNSTIQNEFRLYGRFSYIFKTNKIKLQPTIRQEFRQFSTSHLKNPDEDLQFRTRLRLQLTINLDSRKTHRLIISSEQIFSLGRIAKTKNWKNYNYQESRFSIYYSLSPKTSAFIFSIGYMNNIVGQKSLYDSHYIAFDIVIENPFKLRLRSKESINDNFE